MEINGQRLVFPRNFLFLSRLPSRFEILVVGRGAITSKGMAFELEVLGQRLVLSSKTELKVGGRYDLEKISATEFKIVREHIDTSAVEQADKKALVENREKNIYTDVFAFLAPERGSTYNDLLALKILEENGEALKRKGDKYTFDWDCDFSLRGVFVTQQNGKYTLFISGSAVSNNTVVILEKLLTELGIERVRPVSPDILDRISAGAVDTKS